MELHFPDINLVSDLIISYAFQTRIVSKWFLEVFRLASSAHVITYICLLQVPGTVLFYLSVCRSRFAFVSAPPPNSLKFLLGYYFHFILYFWSAKFAQALFLSFLTPIKLAMNNFLKFVLGVKLAKTSAKRGLNLAKPVYLFASVRGDAVIASTAALSDAGISGSHSPRRSLQSHDFP